MNYLDGAHETDKVKTTLKDLGEEIFKIYRSLVPAVMNDIFSKIDSEEIKNMISNNNVIKELLKKKEETEECIALDCKRAKEEKIRLALENIELKKTIEKGREQILNQNESHDKQIRNEVEKIKNSFIKDIENQKKAERILEQQRILEKKIKKRKNQP